VIDDDQNLTKFIEKMLTTQHIPCQITSTISEAAAALSEKSNFSVILCDHLLPDGMGVDFLRDIRSTHANAARVLMTGLYDKKLALQAINSGEIYRFLLKPFTSEDLLTTVNQSIDHYKLTAENVDLQHHPR